MHIVKRHGHKQPFDERKVYASVYAACLSAHVLHEEAESIANLVTREVKGWIDQKDEVTSYQIFMQVIEELNHLNKEASLMYRTHRDVS
jgi:transcriptional regulator NrdR family protein